MTERTEFEEQTAEATIDRTADDVVARVLATQQNRATVTLFRRTSPRGTGTEPLLPR